MQLDFQTTFHHSRDSFFLILTFKKRIGIEASEKRKIRSWFSNHINWFETKQCSKIVIFFVSLKDERFFNRINGCSNEALLGISWQPIPKIPYKTTFYFCAFRAILIICMLITSTKRTFSEFAVLNFVSKLYSILT